MSNGSGTDKKVCRLKTIEVILKAPNIQGHIQTTCFELAFIENTLKTTGELKNEWLVTGNAWNFLTSQLEVMPNISKKPK